MSIFCGVYLAAIECLVKLAFSNWVFILYSQNKSLPFLVKEVLFFKISVLWNQKAVYKFYILYDLDDLLNSFCRCVDVLLCKLCCRHSPRWF